jgi:pheromone shutdown-related protein TraB
MIKYKNLYLIGTSHVSKDSVKEVEKTILKIKPDFIALELDRRRLSVLENNQRKRINLGELKNLGIKGFVLNFVGAWFEKRIGKKVGVEPGSDMKKAIELAKKFKIPLVLIDQDIKYTITKFLSRVTFREKIKFLLDLIIGKKDIHFDIKKVPSQREIKKIINSIKREYPSFYLTIIKERNEYMGKGIHNLMEKNKKSKTVGIVGAGHEKDIIGEIKLLERI